MWYLHLVNRQMSQSKSDLLVVWTGIRSTLNGVDPYSDAVMREIQTGYYGRPLTNADHVNPVRYAYPAYTAIPLAPLGWLSFAAARLWFLVIMPILMAASVPMWLRVLGIETTRRRLTILIFLTMVSWPMVWALRLGQATLVVAAFLVLGCYLLKSGRDVGAGVFFALATLKPQLAVPLIVWAAVWALQHRRWKFPATLAAAFSLLVLTAQWMLPGWVSRWIYGMGAYSQEIGTLPSLPQFFGPIAGWALLVALVSGSIVALWRMRSCSVNSPEFGAAIGLTLAVTICLLPAHVGGIYNHVLLLPAVLLIIHATSAISETAVWRGIAIKFVMIGFAVMPLAALGATLWPRMEVWMMLPFWNFLLPSVVVAELILATTRAVRTASQPSRATSTA